MMIMIMMMVIDRHGIPLSSLQSIQQQRQQHAERDNKEKTKAQADEMQQPVYLQSPQVIITSPCNQKKKVSSSPVRAMQQLITKPYNNDPQVDVIPTVLMLQKKKPSQPVISQPVKPGNNSNAGEKQQQEQYEERHQRRRNQLFVVNVHDDSQSVDAFPAPSSSSDKMQHQQQQQQHHRQSVDRSRPASSPQPRANKARDLQQEGKKEPAAAAGGDEPTKVKLREKQSDKDTDKEYGGFWLPSMANEGD